MSTEPKSRRRRRKKILRKNDGSLYDATEHRRITPIELRDYVRDGGLFEARRQESGADCTYEVLQSVLGTGMLETLVPGLGGGPLSSLGGLAGLGGLGRLANGGGLGDLARFLDSARGGDGARDDWDDPPRRSPRRSGDEGWDEGGSSQERRRGPRRDRDWPDPESE